MAISVKVIKGAGDAEMEPIRDELISTDWIAVRRGSMELWQRYYERVERQIRVPYGGTLDGEIIKAITPALPSGIYLVTGVTISLEDASGKLTETLDLEGEYRDPEAS